jgi:hypothetical protein
MNSWKSISNCLVTHLREARFYVPEDFEEELEPEDVHGSEKIIEILRKLQGSDVVVDW